jgi:hypothetical protein
MTQGMSDTFDLDFSEFGDSDHVKAIIDKVAELLDFPAFQFAMRAHSDKDMVNAILQHDISFYEDAIKRLNALPDDLSKMCERAKLQRILGKSQEEVFDMCERMKDMYYR